MKQFIKKGKCDLCGDNTVEVQHCTRCCARYNMATRKWWWPWTKSELGMPRHEHKVFGGATV
jgi:hypothetical protein